MIQIDQLGAIATISFPDVRPLCVQDPVFALELRDAVRDSADSDTVKVIVLKTTRADFGPPASAGDAAAAAAARASSSGRNRWHAAYCAPSGLYQNLAYCKKIVVSAVTGHCPSAGSMLVLCSDHTVCASDSRFEAPFASLPEASLVLAALTLRLNRAKAWMLGGKPWDARQALHAGLVNRVTDSAQVASQAQAMAQAAAKMPLDGIAMSKLLVEAFLDTQGVGQDFDMAGLYADALHRALPGVTPGAPA